MNSAKYKKYLDGLYRLYQSNTVIIDTETTGFSKTDEIIDFAAVKFKTGQIQSYQRYFLPTVEINYHATKVHGYTYDKLLLLGAKVFDNYAETISSIVSKYNIIAYNSVFDLRLLKQTFNKFELSVPEKDWHCAMNLYDSLYGKTKLEDACAKFNVEAGNHSALSDAISTRNLLLRILSDNHFGL